MEENSLTQRLRGRAAYLRDNGEVKSPDLMEDAADEIERLQRIAPSFEADEPTLTVTMRYDLSPVAIEGAIRNRLIEMGWTPPFAAAPKAAPQQGAFDADGFRAWLIRNLPDNTIIGNSAWWAGHLTAWVQRFMPAAPQPATAAQGMR